MYDSAPDLQVFDARVTNCVVARNIFGDDFEFGAGGCCESASASEVGVRIHARTVTVRRQNVFARAYMEEWRHGMGGWRDGL